MDHRRDPQDRPTRGGTSAYNPATDEVPDPLRERIRQRGMSAAQAIRNRGRDQALARRRGQPLVVQGTDREVAALRDRMERLKEERDELRAALADLATQLNQPSPLADPLPMAEVNQLNERLRDRLERTKKEKDELETTLAQLAAHLSDPGLADPLPDAQKESTIDLIRDRIQSLKTELQERDATIHDLTQYLNRPPMVPDPLPLHEAQVTNQMLRDRVDSLQKELDERDAVINDLALHLQHAADAPAELTAQLTAQADAVQERLEVVRAERDALWDAHLAESDRQDQVLAEAQQQFQQRYNQQATQLLQQIQLRDLHLAEVNNEYRALHQRNAQEAVVWQNTLNIAVQNQQILANQIQQERQQYQTIIQHGMRYVQELRNNLEFEQEEVRYREARAKQERQQYEAVIQEGARHIQELRNNLEFEQEEVRYREARGKQEREQLLGRVERAEGERALDAAQYHAERQRIQAEQQAMLADRDAVRRELDQLRQRIQANERVEDAARRAYREELRAASGKRVAEIEAEQAERQRQFDLWKQQKQAEVDELQATLTTLRTQTVPKPPPGSGWGPAPKAKPRPKPAATLLPEPTTVPTPGPAPATPATPTPGPVTPGAADAALLALPTPTGASPGVPGMDDEWLRSPTPSRAAPTPTPSRGSAGAAAVLPTARMDEVAQVDRLLPGRPGAKPAARTGGRGKGGKGQQPSEVLPFGVRRPDDIRLYQGDEPLRPVQGYVVDENNPHPPSLEERRKLRAELLKNVEERQRMRAGGPRSWHTASSDDFHFLPVGVNARITIPQNSVFDPALSRGRIDGKVPGWSRTPGSGLRGRPHSMVPPGWTVGADGKPHPPASANADTDPLVGPGVATYQNPMRARQLPPEVASNENDVVWYTVKGTKGGYAARGRLTTFKALNDAIDEYEQATGNTTEPFEYYVFPGVRWIPALETKFPGGMGMNKDTAKLWHARWNEKLRTFVKTRERMKQAEGYTARLRERVAQDAADRALWADAQAGMDELDAEEEAEASRAAIDALPDDHVADMSLEWPTGDTPISGDLDVAPGTIRHLPAQPTVVTVPPTTANPTRVVRVRSPSAAAELLPNLEGWQEGRVVRTSGPGAHVPTGMTPPPALVVHRPTPPPAATGDRYTGGEVATGSTAPDVTDLTRARTGIFADIRGALVEHGLYDRAGQFRRRIRPSRFADEARDSDDDDETQLDDAASLAPEPMRLVDYVGPGLDSVGGMNANTDIYGNPLSPRARARVREYRAALGRAVLQRGLEHMQEQGIPPR